MAISAHETQHSILPQVRKSIGPCGLALTSHRSQELHASFQTRRRWDTWSHCVEDGIVLVKTLCIIDANIGGVGPENTSTCSAFAMIKARDWDKEEKIAYTCFATEGIVP